MSSDVCCWCQSFDVVLTDPDGDGCCAKCAPLLDPDGCCGYCGEPDPVKIVGVWPACIGCLNAFHANGILRRNARAPYQLAASASALTVRERLEAIANEAGVTGDVWHLSLADFAHRIAEARCVKLGLVKARNAPDVKLQNVANEVGR